jgi:hypothetical protein
MNNLQRQDARMDRHYTPSQKIPSPSEILSPFTKMKDYAPFLRTIMENLATKYAKIRCSIVNYTSKEQMWDDYQRNICLPPYMKAQQNFINSIENMDTKSDMIIHIITQEKSNLKIRKTELVNTFDDRYVDLESYLEDGSSYRKILPELKTCLDAIIENHYHKMRLKMNIDINKKAAKKTKFEEKKEKDNAEITITAKAVNKILQDIKALKLVNQKLSKNLQGRIKTDTKKKLVLPKKKLNTKSKKPTEKKSASPKPKKGSKKNGRNPNTSKKVQA